MAIDREETLKKAEKLIRQGKLAGAIEEYVRLVDDQPRDVNAMNALGDLYVRAGDPDRAVAQFARGADYLFGEGFFARASALYKKALKIKPDHDHTLSQLAEIAARQGLLVDAKSYLKQLAERRRSRGDSGAADEAIRRLRLLEEESAGETVPALAVAPPAPAPVPSEEPAPETVDAPEIPEVLLARAIDLAEAGDLAGAVRCLDVVTDVAILEGNWEKAVTALQTFVAAVPHVPALIKLVEVCVDAGLEDPLRQAQGQLADAYLQEGKGAEARFIAEDLLEHEPGSVAHQARLERARALLGITDAPLPGPASEDAAEEPVAEPEAQPEPQPEEDAAPAADAPIEIDLSDLLAGIPPPAAPVVAEAPRDEDPPSQLHAAREAYARAQELLLGGQTREAVALLERAARDPRWRFRASSDLGRVSIELGDLQAGLEWLQRAAEVAPTVEDGFAVLYELADMLQRVGESARALAVLMELEADAGEYRDVRSRIEALSREQTGSHHQ